MRCLLTELSLASVPLAGSSLFSFNLILIIITKKSRQKIGSERVTQSLKNITLISDRDQSQSSKSYPCDFLGISKALMGLNGETSYQKIGQREETHLKSNAAKKPVC